MILDQDWYSRLEEPTEDEEDMLDLAFVDPLIGLIVGDSGRVFRTTDGGDAWVQMASDTEENLLGVAFGEGGLAYAAGRNGAIVRSTDNGATWSFVGSGTERYRGVADTTRRAEEHVARARAAIAAFPDGPARSALLTAAEYAAARDH